MPQSLHGRLLVEEVRFDDPTPAERAEAVRLTQGLDKELAERGWKFLRAKVGEKRAILVLERVAPWPKEEDSDGL